MIDLHVHSTASDGTCSPAGLASLAAETGLTALALTDHDTVSGVLEARRACSRLGIRLIPGIELEVESSRGDFHVLGLGLTEAPKRIEKTLQELKRRRHVRNLGIVKKMRDDGVEVDLGRVGTFSNGKVLGRPHFARFLVQQGVANSVQDAFDRYLGRNKRYYLPIEHLSVEECAGIIRSAGGRTVLAHPRTLGLTITELERQIPDWKERGIEGIEAFHPNAALDFCLALEELARRHGLLVSAGSDFHGLARTDRMLGHTAGGIEIDERFLEWLESA